jgi:hypothetical protein
MWWPGWSVGWTCIWSPIQLFHNISSFSFMIHTFLIHVSTSINDIEHMSWCNVYLSHVLSHYFGCIHVDDVLIFLGFLYLSCPRLMESALSWEGEGCCNLQITISRARVAANHSFGSIPDPPPNPFPKFLRQTASTRERPWPEMETFLAWQCVPLQ